MIVIQVTQMLYYLTAAALIAHTFYWGLGVAWLALPRMWRRVTWLFAPGFGLALQSAVVWGGAHTALAGTNTYARWSELLPLVLLVLAMSRTGWRWIRPWRGVVSLALLMGVVGWIFLAPMARRGAWTLTSSSLGSCDQADYAAGARVLQEFSRQDRTGFLGQSEVTHVGSTEYFFDFWLRLNHFTPSALIAHNGAVLGLAPHQLVSLTGAVLVLFNLAVVLLLARVALGLRGAPLLALAALYALSPLTGYGVHHGALGQLYAAQGIGLLTLAIIGASGARRRGRSEWAFAPLTLAALWLLAGSYNFILLVALAPGLAWLLGYCWCRREPAVLGRTLLMVAAMLAFCALLFWDRFAGLRERFQLFEQFNFGWPVPILTPEGWVGFVREISLQGWAKPVRWVLGLATTVLWLAGLGGLGREKNRRLSALAAIALVLPVAFGWAILSWQSLVRTNASYDAFKILSVFYPGLLVGLCGWLAAAQRSSRRIQLAAGALFAVVLVANASLAVDAFRRMSAPPLRVERYLAGLIQLESDPRVASLNLRVDDFWSRLWANAFLLKKPQYFFTHTYEGRLNTVPKGEWDLSDSFLRALPPDRNDYVILNERFHVVRVGAPGRIDARFGEGWHQIETMGPNRWRWSAGDAQLRLTNPSGQTLRVGLAMRVMGATARDLQVRLGAAKLSERSLDGSLQTLDFGEIVVPPGDSVLTLQSTVGPHAHPAKGDSRPLSFALHELTLETRPVR